MADSPLVLTNQNLRNRSFRGQRLIGADFRGSDIRGCDFSDAQLMGANFQGVRAGRSRRPLVEILILTVIVGVLTGHAISQFIFGSVGQTPESEAWPYVAVLLKVLAAAGATSALRVLLGGRCWIGISAGILSAALLGALLGFFYVGVATSDNPFWATRGAFVGAIGAGAIALGRRHRLTEVVTTIGGMMVNYGFAFLMITAGFGAISVHRWAIGLPLCLVALLYGWFAFVSLAQLGEEVKAASGTSFRGANLSDAQFDQTIVRDP